MTTKNKGRANATQNVSYFFNFIMRRIWIAQYSLESSRQSYALAGRLIGEIMCCIGLVLLRILEVRL